MDSIHSSWSNRNFTENLLKTMNMMTEVDILLIKQIELKYLQQDQSDSSISWL